MKTFLALALLFVSATAAGQPVSSDVSAPSEQVFYSDLNLASAAGKSALEQRIRAAAGRVCDFGGMSTLEEFSASNRCFRSALADGLHRMDEVILAATSRGNAFAASNFAISGQ